MGVAYQCLLPVDLLVVAEAGTPAWVAIDGRPVAVYWPFWNEPAPTRSVSAVRFDAVPSAPGVRPTHRSAVRLHFEVVPPAGTAFANALRLDVHGAAADGDAEAVEAWAARLLRLLRDRTRQWWIGHAHREAESRYVRASIPVDARGEMTGTSTYGGVDVEPRYGDEVPLTPATFAGACAALAGGHDVPMSRELLYDARYLAVRGDLRRSVLDAVVACDFAVLEGALRVGAQRGIGEAAVRGRLSDRDLLANLRRDVPALFGGAEYSFADAHPDAYAQIVRLWAARGQIAHGRLPHVGALGRGAMPTRAEHHAILGAVDQLIRWFDMLPAAP